MHDMQPCQSGVIVGWCCRQRGSRQQHQRKVFFKRTCQRLAKLRVQRIFQQWAQLVGSGLQKQANTAHIAAHYRRNLQVCQFIDQLSVKKLKCIGFLARLGSKLHSTNFLKIRCT